MLRQVCARLMVDQTPPPPHLGNCRRACSSLVSLKYKLQLKNTAKLVLESLLLTLCLLLSLCGVYAESDAMITL
jgi:hypothetical protein